MITIVIVDGRDKGYRSALGESLRVGLGAVLRTNHDQRDTATIS
jgi:hypothetical protein